MSDKAKGVLGVEGSEAIQRRLLRYLESQRTHHALLFVGPEPQKKWEIAKAVAKFLLCPSKKNRPFCDDCAVCRRIEKDIYPDVLLYREQDEDVLKIETVRELCHQMQISPLEARAKICIVDQCHRMNSASANAFLKTLEEPGEGRYFILLTTQPGSLLPTILSRCVQFLFRPEQERVALSQEEKERFAGLLSQYEMSRNAADVSQELSEKAEVLSFLQYLQGNLRDKTLQAHLGERGFDEGLTRTFARFEALVQCEGRLRSNANYGLMLESLLRHYY